MAEGDAQKSEIHETTPDASSSPAPGRQEPPENARADLGHPGQDAAPAAPRGDARRSPDELFPAGVHVRRDDSDVGGPIEIVTDDPVDAKPVPDPNVLIPQPGVTDLPGPPPPYGAPVRP